MLPEIDLAGISIKTFGVFFALNFVAWGAVAARRLRELGRPSDWAYEMVFAAIIGGLVGAKGYYLLEHPGDLGLDRIVSGSGLVWYGGLAGGVVAMLVWARWRGFVSPHLADIAAVGLPLGYAIGRIGCQVSGDGDYGVASGAPWAMAYPDGVVPTMEEVHPTPIYETLAMGLLAIALWHLRDRVRPGVLFALYLVGAGIERFLVELVRRNEAVLAGLTAAQLWSLGLLLVGVAWLAVAAGRGGLAAPRGRRMAT
ncbi:MAG: prolipoprotein diacylglyceryl transferase, partial [Actinomycetota bacterium]|nr:prolipoprotein diacylglyceryl transferase [Actinomycetota bacterium]